MSPRSVSREKPAYRNGAAASMFVAAFTFATGTRAEGVSLAVPLAPVGDPALTVHSPEVRGHRTLRAALLFDHASEPLVVTTPRQEADAIVADQSWVVARASLALSHRYLFALDVPASVAAGESRATDPVVDAAAPSGFGLGDLALTARATLLGRSGGPALFGATATVFVPTGSRSAYAGDGAPRARLVASTGGTLGRFSWAIDAGAMLRPAAQFDGILPQRVGPSLVAGAATGYAVDASRKLTVGPEVSLTSAFTGGAKLLDPRSTSLLCLLGVRYRPADAWVIGVAGGPAVGQAPGAADFHAMAFLAFSPEKEPPPPDRDADRVDDATDACPELAGVASSDPVMNGCPDLPQDADGDAVPDGFDACPEEAGLPTGDRRTHGCPPSRATEISRATVTTEKIAITEQVQFETGTAVLVPGGASDAVLTDVARILQAHPEIERVQIQGHTDDKGTEEFNRELSQRRAEAVTRWLVEHGIAASRLESRGFGRSKPIADNASEEGRARNRRVEFVIVKSVPAPAEERR